MSVQKIPMHNHPRDSFYTIKGEDGSQNWYELKEPTSTAISTKPPPPGFQKYVPTFSVSAASQPVPVYTPLPHPKDKKKLIVRIEPRHQNQNVAVRMSKNCIGTCVHTIFINNPTSAGPQLVFEMNKSTPLSESALRMGLYCGACAKVVNPKLMRAAAQLAEYNFKNGEGDTALDIVMGRRSARAHTRA